MAEKDSLELAYEVADRWRWFYKKGLISRRDFLKAVLVSGGATAAPLVAACSPQPAAPTQPQAPQRPTKDTISVAFGSDLPNLDPHMHFLRFGIIFHYHVFDNLGVRDPKTLRIGPH
ncbi:MAG: hypothetical protein C4315_11930, partial [Chloroflexota bacterium]